MQCRSDVPGLDHRKSIDIVNIENIDYSDLNDRVGDNQRHSPESCSSSSSSGNSSFCSLDLASCSLVNDALELDLNIRQMEETQQRINVTLENLFKLRSHQQHLLQNRQRTDRLLNNSQGLRNIPEMGGHSGTYFQFHGENFTAPRGKHLVLMDCGEKQSGLSHLSESKKQRRSKDVFEQTQNILNGNVSGNDNKLILDNNQGSDNNSNSHQSSSSESPVKKIQVLMNSLLKNKNSPEENKEVGGKTIIQRDRKITRTKETFSVEDFTELIKSLPANHFTPDAVETRKSGLNQADGGTIRNNKILFHIANELKSSEIEFAANLKIICEDFTSFMIHSGSSPVQHHHNSFNNLADIYKLAQDLSQEFQYRIKYWDQFGKISDIFLHHHHSFNVYLPYLANFSSMNKHFDECCSNNPQYRKVCLNFEKLPVCRSLKIQHFLLKPVQRLPQYKLLLGDYLKNLSKADEDYADTVKALKFITDLLKNANDVIL